MIRNPFRLFITIAGCELIGIVSGFFTIESIPSWYAYLNKPFFSPPNWVFGPVWTTLYAFMGISAYLVWEKGEAQQGMKLFIIQLVINFFWSIIFFNFHSLSYAFITIIFLWIFILLTITHFYKVTKWAAYLLIPYILWVSFAGILNLALVILNQ